MPAILVPFVAGAAVGAYVLDKFTDGLQDAGNAVLKIGAVAAVAYLGFEVFKRGGFDG